MRTLLEIRGLRAGYAEPVLGPVDLSLTAGQVLGLWGPNGSGKSTLLRAVLGQARIFDGRIQRRPDLRLGYQRQHPVRPPQLPLTGREYLRYLEADIEGLPERLTQALDLRIDRLSGGQFQLLAVWAALRGPAELVLLDEPTNNLDPTGILVLGEVLRGLPPDRGVLLVSHERAFLERTCGRIVEVRP